MIKWYNISRNYRKERIHSIMKFKVNLALPEDTGTVKKENGLALATINGQTVELPSEISKQIFNGHRKSYPIAYKSNTLKVVKFIELVGESGFSLMKSVAKVDDLVKAADYSIGLTDDNDMYGIFSFNQAMLSANKHPINGVKIRLASLPHNYRMQPNTSLEDVKKELGVQYDILKANNSVLKEYSDEELPDITAKTIAKNHPEFNGTLKVDQTLEGQELTLLAKNKQGYHILSDLVSLAKSKKQNNSQTGYITWKELVNNITKNSENVIIIVGTITSEIQQAINNKDHLRIKKQLETLKKICPNDVYMGLPIQFRKNGHDYKSRIDIADQFNLKCVPISDYRMISQKDNDILAIMEANRQGVTIGENFDQVYGEQHFVHKTEPNYSADLLDNSLDVLDKVEDYTLITPLQFPKFRLPNGFETQDAYFKFLVEKGFKVRSKAIPNFEINKDKYRQRLDQEMKDIMDLHYSGYFLIVADYVNYAKRNFNFYDEETGNRWRKFIKDNGYSMNRIEIGPGRGSAAGALVSYCMSITNVDPLRGDLLFERFLNKDRHDMPDIDIDIPNDKRAEVLNYVRDYYNHFEKDPNQGHVAGMITFNTLKAKNAVADVGRVLGIDRLILNKLSKIIPDDPKTSKTNLLKLVDEIGDLNKMYQDSPIIKKLINLASRVQGLPRNSSQHACGYVITPQPVHNYCPVDYIEDGNHMTMLAAYDHVEPVGLLKMDFLGLKAMQTITNALNMINKLHHQDPDFKELHFEDIQQDAPFNQYVYQKIQQGQTETSFQISSGGMSDLMKKMYADLAGKTIDLNHPNIKDYSLFERLVAGVALYRPGPMDEIPLYIKNMQSQNIEYTMPAIKDILSTTYGVIIYQEQVMQIVRKLAGFSRGDSDMIRKAMGKKKANILKEYQDYFFNGSKEKNIPGGLKLGYSKKELTDIWNEMESFASYAFNKSHAFSYSYITIVMAWLNVYYPNEFMTATLNTASDNSDKLINMLAVTRKNHLRLTPPSVQKSEANFSTDGHQIYFGLSGVAEIKNATSKLLKERQKGQFKTLTDFLLRCRGFLNKRILSSLVYAGCLDCFDYNNRQGEIEAIPNWCHELSVFRKQGLGLLTNQRTFLKKLLQPSKKEMPIMQKLDYEKKYTGFYISSNPVKVMKQKFQKINYLVEPSDQSNFLENSIKAVNNGGEPRRVKGLLVIDKIIPKINRNHETQAIFIFENDSNQQFEAFAFAKSYEHFRDYHEGQCVIAELSLRMYNDRVSISISGLNHALSTYNEAKSNPKTCLNGITLNLSSNPQTAFKELQSIIKAANQSDCKTKIKVAYRIGNSNWFLGIKGHPQLEIPFNLTIYSSLAKYTEDNFIGLHYVKEQENESN